MATYAPSYPVFEAAPIGAAGRVIRIPILVGAMIAAAAAVAYVALAGQPSTEVEPVRQAPSFVAYAVGSLPYAAPLLAAPDPAAAMAAQLPAGTRVRVGGKVAGSGAGAGLLWAAADLDGLTVHGFLLPAALRLRAGEAPPLDLRGVPLSALLSPPEGVRTVPLAEAPSAPFAAPLAATSDGGAGAPSAANMLALDATNPSAGMSAGAPAAVPAAVPATMPGTMGSAAATVDIPWLPKTIAPWIGLLEAAGGRFGVDPELLAIIVLVESGGDPGARSGAGAMGLMQVMPGTAGDIARWRGITGFGVAALHEPAVSIDFGAWYLARQLATFGLADDPDWRTSVARAAAAYNGGPGSVSGWLQGRSLPAEAERYRIYVTGMWDERHNPTSPAYERWLRAGGQRLVNAAERSQAATAWPIAASDPAVAAVPPTVEGAGRESASGLTTAGAAALAAGAVAITSAGSE